MNMKYIWLSDVFMCQKQEIDLSLRALAFSPFCISVCVFKDGRNYSGRAASSWCSCRNAVVPLLKRVSRVVQSTEQCIVLQAQLTYSAPWF